MTDIASWCIRFVPLILGVAFIGGVLILRAVLFYRRHGFSPIHIPAAGDPSAHALLSRILVVCLSVVIGLGLWVAWWPEGLERIDPLYSFRSEKLLFFGAASMLLGAIVAWRAQDDMAASWRVGIDEGERTELVTRGLYSFCRNPIYLGLQLALLGLCGMIPGLLTLLLLVFAMALFQIQVRLEEAYLLSTHGQVYARYSQRVGRFLPWTGRRPEATRSGD